MQGDTEFTGTGRFEVLRRLGAGGMGVVYAAVARHAQGALLGGDEGRRLVREAEEWLASQRVRDPVRLIAMLAPGLAAAPR